MYRVEIFDQSMNFVSACYTDDAQTISLDYLAFDPFQINILPVEAQKGYLCHLTRDNRTVADCVISDIKPGKETQEISLRPLQALFDTEVFYTPVTDAITWISANLDAQFVTNSDSSQLIPMTITATPGGRNFPLTGYNLNPTINILSVITNAFSTWGVVTEASLDLVNNKILVNIYEQTATQTIECDLDNIISSEITLGDSYGSTNKLIVKKILSDGTDPNFSITYYLHTDGTISTTNSDRIVPVFCDVEVLEQKSDTTDADWLAETETMAKERLTPAQYDNEVVLAVWADDKIINPQRIDLGTITTLHIKGTTYYSLLTGITVEGNVYTLTFGAVRTELTKKLSMQGRNSGTSRGGTGGVSSGDGVLYFSARTVSTGTNAELFRITNSAITTATVVLDCVFADPKYIVSDVTWTSYSGYIAFTGTCTTATTANVALGTMTN